MTWSWVWHQSKHVCLVSPLFSPAPVIQLNLFRSSLCISLCESSVWNVCIINTITPRFQPTTHIRETVSNVWQTHDDYTASITHLHHYRPVSGSWEDTSLCYCFKPSDQSIIIRRDSVEWMFVLFARLLITTSSWVWSIIISRYKSVRANNHIHQPPHTFASKITRLWLWSKWPPV